MAPREKKSQLKRGRVCENYSAISCTDLTSVIQGGASEERNGDSSKKPRRSQRLSQSQTTPVSQKQHLPSPITHQESSSSEAYKEGTATPPEGRPSQLHHRPLDQNFIEGNGISSPPQDTQAFSQFVYPTAALSEEVQDEAEEGVWGYLLPLDQKYGKSLVMKKRNACPLPDGMENFGKDKGNRMSKNGKAKDFKKEEEAYEDTKLKGIASGGYLIGRHPECGTFSQIFLGRTLG